MEENKPKTTSKFKSLQWVAKIFAVLVILSSLVPIISFIMAGGVQESRNGNNFINGIALLMALYFIGLVIGFFREGTGGLVGFISLAAFFIYSVFYGKIGEGIFLLSFGLIFFAIPCFLFLLYWYYRRREKMEERQNMAKGNP